MPVRPEHRDTRTIETKADYGIAAEALGGSVGFIGVYYGVQNPVVGWIGHEFHSVVFAFVFSSLVSLTLAGYRDRIATYVVVGTAWGWSCGSSPLGSSPPSGCRWSGYRRQSRVSRRRYS